MLTQTQADLLGSVYDEHREADVIVRVFDMYQNDPVLGIALATDSVPPEFETSFAGYMLMYVGIRPDAQPDAIPDCDCGDEHTAYAIVRGDGQAIPLVQGTVMEAIACDVLNFPTWDDPILRPVEFDDWSDDVRASIPSDF